MPKYHRLLGHEVTVITTNTKHEKGRIVTTEVADYKLSDGQRIIRLDYNKNKIIKKFRYFKIYNLLCAIKPDFIMVHGLGNISVIQVAIYIKKINKKCIVIADNHLDYFNSKFTAKNNIKVFSYRKLIKLLNKYMQKFYKKVFGVTPCRVDYCQKVYGIAPEKTDLLVMGGDDEKIDFEHKNEIRKYIREKHNIKEEDFLVITGGKIDRLKNIHILMQAVTELEDYKVKLIVFGEPDDEMKENITLMSKSKNIRMVGWIKPEETYNYFLASDMAIFPGTHSVLWEQACACGIPSVFKYWEGMNHLDVGGNCIFLKQCDEVSLKKTIVDILNDEKGYKKMRMIAETKAIKVFSYKEISKKTIEL